MKNKALWLSLSAVALTFAVPTRVEALTFTTYTTRSAFEAAVGANNLSTQNFNSFTQDTNFRNSSLVVGDLTLSGNGSRALIDVPPPGFPVLNIDNTPNASLFARSSSGASIGFNTAITAFGADFADISNARDTRFVFNDGSDLAIPFRGDGGSLIDGGFFGFTASSAFNAFDFRAFGRQDGFSIDNLAYGTAQPVPTPAALPGVIGMGLAVWRKRKQATIVGTPEDS